MSIQERDSATQVTGVLRMSKTDQSAAGRLSVTSWLFDLARARLLRARRSHSRGSSGGKPLAGIDNFAFLQCRANHQIRSIAVTVYFFGCDEDGVHGLAHSMHVPVDIHDQSAAIEATGFDDQQVHVAVGPHFS